MQLHDREHGDIRDWGVHLGVGGERGEPRS